MDILASAIKWVRYIRKLVRIIATAAAFEAVGFRLNAPNTSDAKDPKGILSKVKNRDKPEGVGA
jgi:hypothetical protein